MRTILVCLLIGCSTPNPTTADAGGTDATADIVDARAPDGSDAVPPEMSGIVVTGPDVLSKTGLYSDIGSRTIAPDVIEFTPRWSLWADGAEKRRWIQLPMGMTIDTSDMDQWTFPIGTKIWKEFKVDGKIVETRFLWKQGNDWQHWWMAAYRWRQDGTDADAKILGENDVLQTTHDVPTQVDCVRCHFSVVDVGIGFSAIQLSAPQNSQLAKFSGMGFFSKPATQEYDAPGTGIEHDALAYFHVNCGHCHVESSILWQEQTKLVLRLRTTDTTPQMTGAYAAIGMSARHMDPTHGLIDIVAGKSADSQVWNRMNVRDYWSMPPVGTEIVDAPGVKLVGDWIDSLTPGADM